MKYDMSKRIYLSQPQQTGGEMEYVKKAFSTNNLTLFGDNITEFEHRMAQYYNVPKTLAVASGTAALHMGLRALGVGKGDYVFAQSFTFIASTNPILYLGATPIFIDSDEDNWNMSPEALKKAFEWAKKEHKMPKAVVIVDLYGLPAAYDELIPICKEYNVPILEDAAEALGSMYDGVKCGLFGDCAGISFNSNKIITTGGGGLALAKEEAIIDKMRYWSQQAREPLPYYEHYESGYQYRMSNILAGIGCAQVPQIDAYARRRKEIFEYYKARLSDLPVSFMPSSKKAQPNYWLSVVQLEEKEDVLPLIAYLEEDLIETRMAWKPMHLQPIFQDAVYITAKEGTDVSQKLFLHGLCLPSASVMTREEQDRVIKRIREYYENK
ncbi:dTDP-4-amino-4,6-dideoxygalactose transaminase [Eubacterium oxidoreducens]|uniref:dTDP-4-amino-4,6-dideoxygalactose transaminase n=2 Tax=Eubacterium oxidoreducens TaxID=1732 RepID=A0A1G6B4E1_EUBOX|nr:dTDP-4-amino-4,6-dideoxygalactose transaminase [Eubacterium oxidoreducens]